MAASAAAAAANTVGVVVVANVAPIEVNLAGDGGAALHLRLLHGGLDAGVAVGAAQIALALRDGVHGGVGGGVEPAPAGDPRLELVERRVPLLLEPGPPRLRRAAHLVQHIRPGDLREVGRLVGEVAAGDLHPPGHALAAEAAHQLRQPPDAAVAVSIVEVAPALEQPRQRRLAAAGGGLEEPGGGGLGDQGVEQRRQGLLEAAVGRVRLLRASLVDQAVRVGGGRRREAAAEKNKY